MVIYCVNNSIGFILAERKCNQILASNFWRCWLINFADSMDDKFVDVVVFECELLHPATTNGQGPVFWFPFEPIKSGAR
ncbi:Cysteine protease [Trichinella spiralis]|uniref:Cysteine protease n=1 Tax=Trichinella spiralis TaxID=6334 RepID=A0ABR3KY20_TRISP